jgi:hypothetical protein
MIGPTRPRLQRGCSGIAFATLVSPASLALRRLAGRAVAHTSYSSLFIKLLKTSIASTFTHPFITTTIPLCAGASCPAEGGWGMSARGYIHTTILLIL